VSTLISRGTKTRAFAVDRSGEVVGRGIVVNEFDEEDKVRFAGGLEAEIEVVANDPPIDLYYPVAGFEIDLGAKTVGRHLGDLDPPAANVCDCWCYCEFVHNANR